MEANKESAFSPNDGTEIKSLARKDEKTPKREFISWMQEQGYIIRDKNGTLKSNTKWNNKEDRIKAVRKMVDILGKSPLYLKNEDFFNMGLFEVLKIYTTKKGSFPAVFNALKEAYPELNVNVWDIPLPKNIISKNKETADEATRWLVANKNGIVKESDFSESSISFVLSFYKNPFDAIIFSRANKIDKQSIKALAEEYLDDPFVQNVNKRRAAIKFVATTKDSLKQVSYRDFEELGFAKIIDFYNSNPVAMKPVIKQEDVKKVLTWLALSDIVKDFNVWEMDNPPKSLFLDNQIRISSTLWLSKVTGKSIIKLSRVDWQLHGIYWILNEFYRGSEYSAIKEAEDSPVS
ncbi:MAG: hypothetical protein M1465_00420 [Candidatus Marsarchaeota archaeon]|jgi:hypothetical protein|nr:hypothetical protein [Candidatus Marsarchaeota archaeon]